ncbi:MAG: AAA family ATPase [Candidatus Micrarchaeia archaeon]|jgi:ATP-dependent Clp protease ATP-binding subunit ClpX
MQASSEVAVDYAERFYEVSFDEARTAVLRAMKGQKITVYEQSDILSMSNHIVALACSKKYGNHALRMLEEAGPFLLDFLRSGKYPLEMFQPFYGSFTLWVPNTCPSALESWQSASEALLAWGMPKETVSKVIERLFAKQNNMSFGDAKQNEPLHASTVKHTANVSVDESDDRKPVKTSSKEQQPTSIAETISHTDATPAEIAEHYRKSVRGQPEAVEAFAIAIKDHACRPAGVKKSNIMVLGPTGCGKTFLGRISAKYLGVPFGEAKMSTKSSTGYRGDNLSSIFQDVLDQSASPRQLARAIMLLDEIDKLSLVMDDKGFASQLQNELISYIESSMVRAETGTRTTQPIDTTEMLFIGAGAFIGLNYIIGERLNACGRVPDMDKIIRGEIVPAIKLNMPDEELYAQVIPEDLVKYGLRPELVGRFPVITFVRPLKVDDFIDILKNSDSSPLAQQLRLLSEGYKINCNVDESAFEPMALKAVEINKGARSLETICNQVFREIKFNTKPGSRAQIDAAYVKRVLPNNGKATLIR